MKGIFFIGVILLIGLFLILRPVPSATDGEQLTETGTVVAIYEAGEKDIVFQVSDTDQRFYINRGLEKGLNIPLLRVTLLNQPVTFSYPSYWTPLDPRNDDRHVNRIEFAGELIYEE